jgi:hypothetical protein
MGCTQDHPIEPRERILPGLYRCLHVTTIFPVQLGPLGPRPTPTPVTHGELYYDSSVEMIATCACGKYALMVCGSCQQYRCSNCWSTAQARCTGCVEADRATTARIRGIAARQAEQSARQSTEAKERQLAAVSQNTDVLERLVWLAMLLDQAPAADAYEVVWRVCPFLPRRPGMRFWDPLTPVLPTGRQTVPWDSALIGRWFLDRARRAGIRPMFRIVEGRLFRQTREGWRLIAGSNVRRPDGYTDAAFLLSNGTIIRGEAPQEPRPGLVVIRHAEPTDLNLTALAELGRVLRLRPPAV